MYFHVSATSKPLVYTLWVRAVNQEKNVLNLIISAFEDLKVLYIYTEKC